MSLYDELNKISEQVRNQRHLMNNEDATILVSIQPFIRALGYNTANLMEVRPQYSADAKSSGGERVDYAIIRESKPIIFIEAKAANLTLNDNYWKQLHHYFNAEDVRFGILTNGIEYRFYTDLKKRNIMDKEPFLVLDMLKLNKQLVMDLEPFTREYFNAERIIASAKIQRIVHLLQEEMNSPSDGIVKHFAGRVYSGNANARIIQDLRPLVRAAFDRFVEQKSGRNCHPEELSESVSTPPSIRYNENETEYADEPIPREHVLIPVYAKYEGEDITAQFKVKRGYKKRGDKVILYEGVWKSVSRWAQELKNRIHRKLNIKKSAETAGWTNFWYYKDAQRKEGILDDFRKNPELVDRYLRNKQQ